MDLSRISRRPRIAPRSSRPRAIAATCLLLAACGSQDGTAARPDASSAADAGRTPSTSASGLPGSGDTVFAGFGTWVDTYDYRLDPERAVADMRTHGVRTLYLSTARADTAGAIARPDLVDRWLASAHVARIRVVGWYVPDYADLDRDVTRSVAIARYRSADGERFDGLAVDMEYPVLVRDAAAWHAAVTAQLVRVRAATRLPLAAIVLPPPLMAAWPDRSRWAAFPWRVIATHADAVLVMDYWTSHTPARLCPTDARFCAREYTTSTVSDVRRLTGLPVHVIGGVGDAASASDTAAFADAATHSAVIGASFYDYATTSAADWAALRPLAS